MITNLTFWFLFRPKGRDLRFGNLELRNRVTQNAITLRDSLLEFFL